MPDHGGHIHPPGHFCGSNCPKHKPRTSSAAQGRFEATISPGVEYGTERPCEIGRITYTAGVHRYVALTFRYTDRATPWRLTWVGWADSHEAMQLPEGIYPSEAMLAALAVAPVEVAA